MSTTTPTASSTGLDVAGDRDDRRASARRSTETKASLGLFDLTGLPRRSRVRAKRR